jgi:hypothetical protein
MSGVSKEVSDEIGAREHAPRMNAALRNDAQRQTVDGEALRAEGCDGTLVNSR